MVKSRYTLLIILAAFAALLYLFIGGNKLRRDLGADSLGYYMYLPSTFIYHNNKSLEKLPSDKKIPEHTIQDAAGMKQSLTPLGYTKNQYTIGVAVMEMPFFFMAHAWEKITGGYENGYSDTYIFFLFVCDAFYTILGLFFVFLVLKRYFSETNSVLSVITLFFGTNLLWFTVAQAGMSHVPLFCLYAALVYLTIRLHDKPSAHLFIASGITAGLITVIRPTDIICILIPILYNVPGKENLSRKLNFIKLHYRKILFAAGAFLIPVIPQLIYWKIMSGNFLYYSYGDQKFNWTDPKIAEGLFSSHNGWLVYSPVMIFSVIGLFLYKRIKHWALCIWTILPIYVYVIYSWYCYTYMNGFGSRPMIHLYPLLAIPLAASIQFISSQRVLVKSIIIPVYLILFAASISFTLQQGSGRLISEASNLTYNLQVLFRPDLNYNDLVTFDLAETQPDDKQLSETGVSHCEHFDDSVAQTYERDTSVRVGFVYHMTNEEFCPKQISVVYSRKDLGEAKYFKCSGRFMYPVLGGYTSHYLVLQIGNSKRSACKIENKIDVSDGTLDAKNITLTQFHNNKWGYAYFYARIPDGVPYGQSISLHVWNPQNCELYIDDLCLQAFK